MSLRGTNGTECGPREAGSLVIVGTGIKSISHVTLEAEAHIRQAEKLFYLVADSVTEQWLLRLNSTAESLYRFYGNDKDRAITYEEMISCLIEEVQAGKRVCCALYGHPSVFAYPGREAVRRLRELGFEAAVLPGVSAEDCLFADLGIDPGTSGCQSFEATDFLIRQRRFDPNSTLILWQAALIAVLVKPSEAANRRGLQVLADYLIQTYGRDHRVKIYQAAQYALCGPSIIDVSLCELVEAQITPICTLVVPPLAISKPDPNFLSLLGMKSKD
jgi:siroheme synthase